MDYLSSQVGCKALRKSSKDISELNQLKIKYQLIKNSTTYKCIKLKIVYNISFCGFREVSMELVLRQEEK